MSNKVTSKYNKSSHKGYRGQFSVLSTEFDEKDHDEDDILKALGVNKNLVYGLLNEKL